MTQTIPDDSSGMCVVCGPLSQFSTVEPMLLAVHEDGTTCRSFVHRACVAYIEQNGVFADQTCPCGRVVYGGTANTTTPGGAQPEDDSRSDSSDDDSDDDQDSSDTRRWDAASYEPPTLRGSDEDAADSDNDDSDNDDS